MVSVDGAIEKAETADLWIFSGSIDHWSSTPFAVKCFTREESKIIHSFMLFLDGFSMSYNSENLFVKVLLFCKSYVSKQKT